MTDSRSIGVFDSGIGGLTVVRELFSQLPDERVVYFGDTARYPYGSKSESTVTTFARQDCEFLLSHDVKLIVVACNTASAFSLPTLVAEYDVPIVGVIGPGALAATAATRRRFIGVIGTEGTISSGAYQKAIGDIDTGITVFAQACPLFVALAEEGYTETDAAFLIASDYLSPLREARVDTVVLGCTHYPLLKNVIRRVLGPEITLVDSAEETASVVASTLAEMGMLANGDPQRGHSFFVSDVPLKFRQLGERFLGHALPSIQHTHFV